MVNTGGGRYRDGIKDDGTIGEENIINLCMYMGQSVVPSKGRGDLAARTMFDSLDGTAIFEYWSVWERLRCEGAVTVT
jgi:hypothetical protein